MTNEPKVYDIFKHHKGGTYVITSLAIVVNNYPEGDYIGDALAACDIESGDVVVYYEPIIGDQKYVRSQSNFMGDVTIPRFRRVEQKPPPLREVSASSQDDADQAEGAS